MSPASDGFITPAASVIAMALSVIAAAAMTRSLQELRLSKADFAKTQAEYALDGAQNGAALAIATSNQPPPYHWTLASLGQAVDVLAEPEHPKLTLAALASLDDDALEGLGLADPATLRRDIAAAQPRSVLWLADKAGTPGWKACAPSLASQFGGAAEAPPLVYQEPLAGQRSGNWRAGEVWRIQATAPNGWRDERIIRFTGNGLAPAAVIDRRLSRGWKGAQTCGQTFGGG